MRCFPHLVCFHASDHYGRWLVSPTPYPRCMVGEPYLRRVHASTSSCDVSLILLLELRPRTGRTHQLRRHCAETLRAPILGDTTHGAAAASNERGCGLVENDHIATIIDYYGNELCKLSAPEDGMIFGLRALPNVTIGEWCCFFAIIEGEW